MHFLNGQPIACFTLVFGKDVSGCVCQFFYGSIVAVEWIVVTNGFNFHCQGGILFPPKALDFAPPLCPSPMKGFKIRALWRPGHIRNANNLDEQGFHLAELVPGLVSVQGYGY